MRFKSLVAQHPGMCIRELAQHLGIRRTSVVHHLRKLRTAHQIRCVRSGRRLLVFPPAVTAFEGLVGLLRLRTIHNVVSTILGDPGISVRGLARQLNLTPRAIRYHLLRLQDLGVLEMRWGKGGRRILVLDPKAADLMPDAAAPALQEPVMALARQS